MIEEILAYQTADAKLKDIEKKLSDNEDRKRAVVAKKYLESVGEKISKLDSRAAKLVEEFNFMLDEQQKLTEQEEEFKRTIDGVEDEAEANFLIKKIDELSQKLKNLVSKISNLSAEISAVSKEYSKVKSETKSMQAQYTESGKKYNEFKATLKDERDAVEKELAILKEKVEPTLMDRYLKKRAAKMYPIIVEAKETVCGRCNIGLNLSEQGKLKNGEIIECEQCGVLMFWAKK